MRGAPGAALAVLVALVVLAQGPLASAQPACSDAGRPVVVVAFQGELWEESLETEILTHLRAGLEPAGFVVCLLDQTRRAVPVATVDLRRSPGERIVVTIEVQDGVTAKRVARTIDLSALPPDGRGLGVGVAADELLRASWLELALADAPAPKRPPPPAVQRTVERSLAHRDPARSELGARAAAEGYGGGLFLLGGDLAFRHWFARKLGVELALGLRQAKDEQSVHGTIAATALGIGGGAFVELARVASLRFHLEGGVWAAQVRMRATAGAGSAARDGSEIAVLVRGGAALGYGVSRSLVLSARGGAGGALRAVSARDYGTDRAGVSGLEWYAALGPSVAF